MAGTERGLHAHVLDTLGQDIVDGRIPVGNTIDPISAQHDFGVSRSVIREALRVLQSLGMVEPRQRTGTVVLPRTGWDLLAPAIIRWRGSSPDYYRQQHEILELRLGVEPVAAALAAAHPSVGDAVRSAANTMLDAVDQRDDRAYLDADIRFHTELLRGSGNTVFGHFAATVEALLRTRTSERRTTITDWTPDAAHRHLDVATALHAGDGTRAAEAARTLIRATIIEFTTEAVNRPRVSAPDDRRGAEGAS